ncbi:DNA-binding transcriptional repressor MarR (plasmid) [Aminobacter sp. MSH1]|uniref:MarR family winged helix-turn-helix transcriptional regulator n=1 Tax=Aminobacter sp. MSH1 TaxID=374606 RepID=UPI000620951E|nr:MarR family transcriptional regulator [Aminobacter sp. MSH1]AKD43459.1 DNA-binding transcriptional repressor MarR [Aminobacter sp. MSH1]
MPDQDLSHYLSYLLASANRNMRLRLTRSICDEECTEEHWRILQVLSDEQGHSMGELAEVVLLNHPALTKNMDKLVNRGLVQRSVDPLDNRRVLVFISDLGKATVNRLNRRVNAHHSAIEEALGPRKTTQLKRLLETFISQAPQH